MDNLLVWAFTALLLISVMIAAIVVFLLFVIEQMLLLINRITVAPTVTAPTVTAPVNKSYDEYKETEAMREDARKQVIKEHDEAFVDAMFNHIHSPNA